MRPKTIKITNRLAAKIVYKMFQDGWTDEEVSRFLDYWWHGGGNRVETILKWTSDPEDEIDTRLDRFLREFFDLTPGR